MSQKEIRAPDVLALAVQVERDRRFGVPDETDGIGRPKSVGACPACEAQPIHLAVRTRATALPEERWRPTAFRSPSLSEPPHRAAPRNSSTTVPTTATTVSAPSPRPQSAAQRGESHRRARTSASAASSRDSPHSGQAQLPSPGSNEFRVPQRAIHKIRGQHSQRRQQGQHIMDHFFAAHIRSPDRAQSPPRGRIESPRFCDASIRSSARRQQQAPR